MAQQYKLITETVEVPKNTAKAGLMRTLAEIIDMPRVVDIHLECRRPPIRISYERYSLEGEPSKPLAVDLQSLAPYSLLRNGEIEEIEVPSGPASLAVAALFREVSQAGLWPVAFVGGAATRFWAWHKETMGGFLPSPTREDAYGLPFYTDRQLGDDALLMAAAFTRTGALIDAERAFKVLIPERPIVKEEISP